MLRQTMCQSHAVSALHDTHIPSNKLQQLHLLTRNERQESHNSEANFLQAGQGMGQVTSAANQQVARERLRLGAKQTGCVLDLE